MKRILHRPTFVALALAACALPAAAQRTRTIAPGSGTNLIRTFIENDLAATDTATVEGTVYFLQRGGHLPLRRAMASGIRYQYSSRPGGGSTATRTRCSWSHPSC